MFSFSYEKRKYGRLGYLETPHGPIETPAFVFCATQATIKGLLFCELNRDILLQRPQLVFCNTMHLRRQAPVISELGGLHSFCNWNFPIITDSGGFQIFSLGSGLNQQKINPNDSVEDNTNKITREIKGIQKGGSQSFTKVTEMGCEFRCPINGERDFFTPERSIYLQSLLGADLIVAFDECTSSSIGPQYAHKSTLRSNRWAVESRRAYDKYCDVNRQRIYGVIQGGTDRQLRNLSLDQFAELDFFGAAIGGTLGKTSQEMYDIVNYTAALIDLKHPRHLLGVGRPLDIVKMIGNIDTFDCVEPTRIARHGIAITTTGNLNLRKKFFEKLMQPIDRDCACSICEMYSCAYIHHLLRVNEIAGVTALTLHNIFAMNKFMLEVRECIKRDENPLSLLIKV